MIATDGTATIVSKGVAALPAPAAPGVYGPDQWPMRSAVDGLHPADPAGINVGRDGRSLGRID